MNPAKKFLDKPTKTEIMEQSWLEFLQYCKKEEAGKELPPNPEGSFWIWYINNKLEEPDEISPEAA